MKKTVILFFLFINFLSSSAQDRQPVQTKKAELIFPMQEKHVHGSSIISLPNGDLLAAWFYGSGERNADDVKIMGARLKKGASNWSESFELADTYGLPDCNPVLFLNAKGKLFLVWIAVQANRWENSVLRFKTSVDYNGEEAPIWNWQDNILLKPDESFAKETESKFKQLPDAGNGWSAYAPKYDQMIIDASKDISKRSTGWMTRIHPLILKNGRIVLPLYSDGFNMSLMAISDDDGTTWRSSLPVVGRGPIQPALAQRKNGDIIAFMRDSGDEPNRVQTSTSNDNGASWSAAIKTDIPNTASVEVCVLKDGRWIFIGNDIEGGRYRLSLYLSNDEGQTWTKKYTLENEEKGAGSFSYPSVIQSSDELVHITYSYHKEHTGKSIKYVCIDVKNLRP